MVETTALRIGYQPGTDVTLDRLQDQIEWYDKKAAWNQRRFKSLKVSTILSAALVPICASVSRVTWVAAALGVAIAVIEGLQQLNQYHANWIAYRSTCEALKHEKFLFLAAAGLYGSATDARALLAERLESLVSHEHAKWMSTRGKGESKDDHPRKPE
jgi:hypothetical protein